MVDVMKLIANERDKPYDSNSPSAIYTRKVVRAKKCIKAINPEFVEAMDLIRESFGRNWKDHQNMGSYEAWDNAILAYYEQLPEDKKYPGGLEKK